MVKEAIQSDTIPRFKGTGLNLENFHLQNQVIASEWQGQVEALADTTQENSHNCICLNFEDLKCFEAVERQYESLGVIFHECLAIQPSNPAFPTHSGSIVLMGSPQTELLEVTFLRPVNQVSALVTSSQRLVLSAYGRDRQLIAQTVLPVSNLANSDSAITPNAQLSVAANEIYSVTFSVFNGLFTLDNFRFCA
ncbi:hypothetical protein NIES37_21010 [Tolypothrix tenuis PCC 7101]|uniref:Uncharacterized protein n=1 Tax=Tolypothrix tenuis PCC 7101 TaxID=231146 RepID=A0A1Z4MXH3_9CYAN|nr:hypothetical protein [Aulosira sp. FACHB-113]BAY98153.1 hypothetical protein NIES37_21010 [Tolypothrix tenuis PCC 7101]BAZ77928.1 hypothetical protein NIES50_65610 [Aulosira laxa NIES-50]